jgi:hypothetical protein
MTTVYVVVVIRVFIRDSGVRGERRERGRGGGGGVPIPERRNLEATARRALPKW